MKKITFIGAGSLDFTKDLARDILTFDAFRDAELMLMDIDPKRLEYAVKGVQKVVDAGNYPAVVKSTMDRRKALEGADGVLITILQGGVEVWRSDIEIPQKYHVDICVGDTRGPSGIFRFLRTAPVMLDIIRDCEDVCPDAIVLNYTNPMAMLVSYLAVHVRYEDHRAVPQRAGDGCHAGKVDRRGGQEDRIHMCGDQPSGFLS